MKKAISKVLLTALSAAVILSACSKAPEESRFIPKTAGVVLELNAKQLTTKLVSNGITMDKLFEAVQQKDTSNEVMKAWKDAENSGVDLQSHFFLSVVTPTTAGLDQYVSVTASLKDADKFEAFVKKQSPDLKIETKNDLKYFWKADEQCIVGWTKSTTILIKSINTNELKKFAPGQQGFPAPGDAPAEADSTEVSPVALVSDSNEAAWLTELDHLFHLKKDESAASIEPFNKLLKENADAGLFFNAESFYNSTNMTMIPANFKKLMEGTYYASTINFENGKIVCEGDSYLGKEMTAIMKKYGSKEIDYDLIKKYPGTNITGLIAYAFDFHMIGDIIKLMSVDGMVNMSLAKSGVTLDDILDAFEGQLAYVASDFAITKQESQYMPGHFSDKPSAKWIFTLKVGKKEAFDKIMTSPMLKDVFAKEGDHYVITNPMMAATAPPMSITDKYITLGSDSTLLQEYLAGKGSIKLPEGVESKLKGNMMAGYVDLDKLVNSVPDSEVDADAKPLFAKAKELFKDAYFNTKMNGNDKQHGEIVINFKNKDQNSLVQLVNFGTEAAKLIQEKKAKEEGENAAIDSAAANADTVK
ncbi:DUF4836 family protein [Chitinophaga silvatica]|uniref:DUF4836 family protein n=1 Tax=Chitinophaga silvatica TaxID=2282649 RepID=A0A3E1YB95_9BACT|nr:DUF4836 family protein [Chitinophaga silvatica]RFS23333.1 DUF4836 family protein [Chitinophaga silvatica]